MFNFPFSIISSSKLNKLKDFRQNSKIQIAEILSNLEAQRGVSGAILNSMNDGVLAVNDSGEVIMANPSIEKMFGVLEPDILGRKVREVIRNNEITELVEKCLAGKEKIKEEINIVIPFEATFDVDLGPVLDSNKNVLGVVCVLHDISELRKLEKHRTEFVANVSHELKTPLTSIRNYVETLLMGGINDKQHNIEFLNKIEKHSNNLSALIDDILELSSLETKKNLGSFTPLDIHKLFSKAIEVVLPQMKKKSISIKQECSGNKLIIMGIEDHVYRAILNLLDNAINYSNSGSEICVSCGKVGDNIQISIKDNGIGIAEENIPRLFERFYRVDTARSRDMGGTGLGLAIVKHVMNVHNGLVSVESELGRGSTFTLAFPAA